jgi:dihydroflavonol-4-reductase
MLVITAATQRSRLTLTSLLCFCTARSKTLAEKAAWQFVADRTATGERCFELAVINPSFVIGPTLSSNTATSFAVATKLLLKEMPAVPNVGLTVVDVR